MWNIPAMFFCLTQSVCKSQSQKLKWCFHTVFLFLVCVEDERANSRLYKTSFQLSVSYRKAATELSNSSIYPQWLLQEYNHLHLRGPLTHFGFIHINEAVLNYLWVLRRVTACMRVCFSWILIPQLTVPFVTFPSGDMITGLGTDKGSHSTG